MIFNTISLNGFLFEKNFAVAKTKTGKTGFKLCHVKCIENFEE